MLLVPKERSVAKPAIPARRGRGKQDWSSQGHFDRAILSAPVEVPPRTTAPRRHDGHFYMLGYPEDRRSDRVRMRRFRSVLGDVDGHAARVVARLLGERVVLQDDGSEDRLPDLLIEYADGRKGAVEVVANIDEHYAEMWEHVIRRGHQIPSSGLRRAWFVRLNRRANLQRVERLLPAELRRIEQTSADTGALNDVPDGERLGDLGVVSVRWAQPATGDAPAIQISPEGAFGPDDVDVTLFSSALDEVIADAQYKDVWRKLNAADVDERHVFFGLTFSSDWSAYRLLRHDSRELPARPPALPASVRHLWVMNVPFSQRCLHWSTTNGWIDVRQHWATE